MLCDPYQMCAENETFRGWLIDSSGPHILWFYFVHDSDCDHPHGPGGGIVLRAGWQPRPSVETKKCAPDGVRVSHLTICSFPHITFVI